MSDVTFDGKRWSNADVDPIVIVAPDPDWPAQFESEAGRIRAVLAPHLEPRIEHVGSTAIPAIAAKPIIDILIVPPPDLDRARLIAPLESLDYVYWAENPRGDRMFFVKGMPPSGTGRTHHVHVRGPADALDMLSFRDHLIAHPDVAARYEMLKRRLARRYPTDRKAYTRAKGRFVEAVLRRARTRAAPDPE